MTHFHCMFSVEETDQNKLKRSKNEEQGPKKEEKMTKSVDFNRMSKNYRIKVTPKYKYYMLLLQKYNKII